ncbi:MAG: hypothetical protein EO766_18050 [Hydrotalea sp. AMD]|uniref:hypothetical protein n=1 Tax=Hydrotalea sp. AMD TaxID=2501297 RepID=UPI00102785CC|nr:hypothetical protein [Hydrotalea sp. AMD]RWZ82320.1 MAG: hypothetical protein EO766_18050 [Hydrotalea sp. AMD]
MKLGFYSWFIAVLYGLVFVLPVKIKIWKKHGLQIAYQDMVKLANEGNLEIIKLRKRTKIMLAILVGGVLIEINWRLF